MALPTTSKTNAELAEMSDDQLFRHFSKHARFCRENPKDSQYAIMFGSKTLFSDDTQKLREKFFKAVRK